MARQRFTQVRKLAGAEQFAQHLADLGAPLDFDTELEATGPLAQPIELFGKQVSNRFCILPMEGWDAEDDGLPSDLVRRRWNRFGASGAKLVWFEATAVLAEGRANPRQLVMNETTVDAISAALEESKQAHRDAGLSTDDLVTGLQLTHSGRWSRPNGGFEPKVAYRHPWLDSRGDVDDSNVFTDDEFRALQDQFVASAHLVARAGFDFVDVKCCHGYLLHEMLTAHTRPGPFGGDFEGRTRFVREVIERIRAELPDLGIAVRLSAYDIAPFDAEVTGEYPYAFGGDGTGRGFDLTETHQLLDMFESLGVELVCVTAGSPYYSSYMQRPAFFAPSDAAPPPHDPLIEVVRMLDMTAELTEAHPNIAMVGTGYSYLQEWLPYVGQRQVRDGRVDFVGLGRMALSYPDMPLDVLGGNDIDRRKLCRTFSDCTTAPRNGMISGCFPIDPFYKERPERGQIVAINRAKKASQ